MTAKILQADTAQQHKAAKVSGLVFLFFITSSILHYSIIELHLVVLDNINEIATFIMTNELLFRIGIAVDLILFTSGIILSLALYVVLKPVNKNLVRLAFIFMVLETVVSIVIELSSFIALSLFNGKKYLLTLEEEHLQTLLGLILHARADGYGIVVVFFNLGFILFSYLFFDSNYIPKILASLGMLSSLLMLIFTLLKIIFPYTPDITIQISAVLVMLFQLVTGMWLLFKGIKLNNSSF